METVKTTYFVHSREGKYDRSLHKVGTNAKGSVITASDAAECIQRVTLGRMEQLSFAGLTWCRRGTVSGGPRQW